MISVKVVVNVPGKPSLSPNMSSSYLILLFDVDFVLFVLDCEDVLIFVFSSTKKGNLYTSNTNKYGVYL